MMFDLDTPLLITFRGSADPTLYLAVSPPSSRSTSRRSPPQTIDGARSGPDRYPQVARQRRSLTDRPPLAAVSSPSNLPLVVLTKCTAPQARHATDMREFPRSRPSASGSASRCWTFMPARRRLRRMLRSILGTMRHQDRTEIADQYVRGRTDGALLGPRRDADSHVRNGAAMLRSACFMKEVKAAHERPLASV